jgi:hypothetical protein
MVGVQRALVSQKRRGQMRRKTLGVLVGAATVVIAVLLAGPVSAAPGRGCPTGGDWHLGPVSDALPGLDTGNFGDQNGDGLGCHKVNKGQTAVHAHDVGFDLWTWKDNTN